MFISYFDESGDDGYPKYSSPLFVLTSLYMHYLEWKNNYEYISRFRKKLKEDFDFPVKFEFHTLNFLADKDPYHGMYTPAQRKEILTLFLNLIASLNIKFINVAIDKTKIKRGDYNVLENALTYNIQRIENDMTSSELSPGKFMIITDEGRLSKMRYQARKIQRVNFIPSKINPFPYRKEIENLIEDPLPKKSSESYFIQLSDIVATIVYYYVCNNLMNPKIKWANRVLGVLNYGDELSLLDIIEKNLNLKASHQKYGIVYYPK